jgi:hypothetical protein
MRLQRLDLARRASRGLMILPRYHLPSRVCPALLLADQPDDRAIVVELAPIPFAVAYDVVRRHLRGAPGEVPEAGLLERPLIRGLPPLVPPDAERRGSEKLCLAGVPFFLGLQAQQGDAILRAVRLPEGERRVVGVGDEAPATRLS